MQQSLSILSMATTAGSCDCNACKRCTQLPQSFLSAAVEGFSLAGDEPKDAERHEQMRPEHRRYCCCGGCHKDAADQRARSDSDQVGHPRCDHQDGAADDEVPVLITPILSRPRRVDWALHTARDRRDG